MGRKPLNVGPGAHFFMALQQQWVLHIFNSVAEHGAAGKLALPWARSCGTFLLELD